MKIKFINREDGTLVSESPPAENLLKFLYENSVGKSLILPLAKRKIISSYYGRKMDKPSSKKKIREFVDKLQINMEESEKTIEEFATFNDFFYRKLKKDARPIGDGLISPGDGKLLAFKDIQELKEFFIKGSGFSLSKFLNNQSLAEKFKDSSMIILRLAPNDYHRYHFPFDGIPSETTLIKGHYYSVSPYALAKNFVKVFLENKRELCELKTSKHGNILIVPVGATMVGSIHSTYTSNAPVKKGEEMGYFAFGGSTIVMLFSSNKFTICEDLLKNSKNKLETAVKMGEQIGEIRS